MSYITILKNTIKRLSSRHGVKGVIILDKDGFTLDTDLPPDQSEQISAHVGTIINRVMDVVNAEQNVKNLRKDNEIYSAGKLKEILISLETMELLIIPNEEIGFNLVLVQDIPSSSKN